MLVINRQTARVIETPHGSEIRPLIDRTTSKVERCSLAEEVLPAGARVASHFHRETEEIYYIISGEGLMSIEGEARPVRAGDAIYIPRESWHSLENTGHEAMTLLLICGPAYLVADHLFEASARPDSGD